MLPAGGKLTLFMYDPEAWRTMARNGNFRHPHKEHRRQYKLEDHTYKLAV